MGLIDSDYKFKAIVKAFVAFVTFIGVCALVVYFLVYTSNQQHARGGDSFGSRLFWRDRSNIELSCTLIIISFLCKSTMN